MFDEIKDENTGVSASAEPRSNQKDNGDAALREQNDQMRRQLDYLAADFDTFRRRTHLECLKSVKDAQMKVFAELIVIMDDFENALKEIDKKGSADFEAHSAGFRLMYQSFTKLLERYAVMEVQAQGIFDPLVHEAIMQRPAPAGVVAGTILEVLQKGYSYGGSLLRAAKVVVAA